MEGVSPNWTSLGFDNSLLTGVEYQSGPAHRVEHSEVNICTSSLNIVINIRMNDILLSDSGYQGTINHFLFPMKCSTMLMGMGKMMVELCSADMVLRVCRYRSCNTQVKKPLSAEY